MTTATSTPGPSPSNDQPKIIVHWLEASRGTRLLFLLEELKLQYEVKAYKRGADKLAPEELKKIHPLGKSPAISISAGNEAKPLVLAESGAVFEYCTKHFGPQLIPQEWTAGKEGVVGGETEEWLRYRYYMHYAEGSLMPYLIVMLVADGIKNAKVPFFIKPITNSISGNIKSSFVSPQLTNNFDFLESQLASSPGGGEYLCGKNVTAADILMSFPVGAAKQASLIPKEKYPKICAYVEKLESLESFKRAQKRINDTEGTFNKTAYV
ncbi:hypothetical protein MMC25_002239 [Agyrium rufum]|nr:hypothetical protein [Agyrium rufum]